MLGWLGPDGVWLLLSLSISRRAYRVYGKSEACHVACPKTWDMGAGELFRRRVARVVSRAEVTDTRETVVKSATVPKSQNVYSRSAI